MGRKKYWLFQNRVYTEKSAHTLKGCISLNYSLHSEVILMGQNSLSSVYYFHCFMKLVLQILAVIWQSLNYTTRPYFVLILGQPFKRNHVLDLCLLTN